MINIYTDGSSTKDFSGYGYVIVELEEFSLKKGKILLSRYKKLPSIITNQQAELLGAILGYSKVRESGYNDQINIYSDSAYLINCYQQQWYKKWEINNWINSKGNPVANKILWEKLIPIFKDPLCDFIKIKGHAGHLYNELADALATQQLDKAKKILYNIQEREKKRG